MPPAPHPLHKSSSPTLGPKDKPWDDVGVVARFLALLWVLCSASALAAETSKQNSFDPQILERYVGYYQADPKTRPDTMVDVGRAGDRLTIQIPGYPKNTLTPQNERQFSFYRSDEQVTATVTFPTGKSGPADKVTLRQNGVDTVMTRINVKAALEVADRAMLNTWFSSAAGLSSAPDPGVPLLPTWSLAPRTATSIPLGTVVLDKAPATIATLPLAKHGYVEEEYFISGRGNIYAIGGKRIWRGDLPYTTRILVRRPANPKAFSGTIHMEAARDGSESATTLMDIWPLAARDGDVLVAATPRSIFPPTGCAGTSWRKPRGSCAVPTAPWANSASWPPPRRRTAACASIPPGPRKPPRCRRSL